MGVIFYLSSIPQDTMPSIEFPFFDKLAHITVYMVLGLLLMRAIHNNGRRIELSKALFLAISIGALYGLSDEIHQLFVSGRSCDIFDFFFDALGATIGAVLIYVKRQK